MKTKKGFRQPLDLAARTATRPRFRITADALEALELHRSLAVPTKTIRRKRRPAEGVIEFF